MIYDLIKASNELLDKQNKENIWDGKPFEPFHYLNADYSGKAGEIGFYEFLKRAKENKQHDWDIIYGGDSNLNPFDGTYDIVIQSKSKNRIGIKTARIGKQKSFQHDNLHEGECDYEILIDITPNNVYLTVIDLKNYSLNEKHLIFNSKPHLRKNTTNNFKLDLRESQINKGIVNNITIKLDENTTDEDVVNFLKKFID